MQHVLFHVDCVYGVGHYRRIELVARALQAHRPDWRMTIMTGGPEWAPFRSLPRCQVVPLPGLQYRSIDAPEIVGMDGRPAGPVLSERLRIIEEALATARISTVVFECFPFSNQFLTEEARAIVGLVRKNCPAARAFSSVRDIAWNHQMQASPERWKATAETLTDELIDGVLVHSDPGFLPFDYCWGGRPAFAPKVHHTGFVTEQSPPRRPVEPGPSPVVCSVGGGKDGLSNLRVFLHAWEALQRRNELPRDWRGCLFTGRFEEIRERDRLFQEYEHLLAGPSATLQPGSWDRYRETASRAGVSVSMCGYNTCYELLSWGVRAIFLPRVDREQTVRARRVQERGWAQVATNRHSLADALQRAATEPRLSHTVPELDFNGAARTVQIIAGLHRADP